MKLKDLNSSDNLRKLYHKVDSLNFNKVDNVHEYVRAMKIVITEGKFRTVLKAKNIVEFHKLSEYVQLKQRGGR